MSSLHVASGPIDRGLVPTAVHLAAPMSHPTKVSSAVLWGAILSLLALAMFTPREAPDARAAAAAAQAARRVPLLWALPIDGAAFEESVGRRPTPDEAADIHRADSTYMALVTHRSVQQGIGAATRDQLLGAVAATAPSARTVVVGYARGGMLHLRSGGTFSLDALAERARSSGRAVVVVALGAEAASGGARAIPRALDLALAVRARLQTNAPPAASLRRSEAPPSEWAALGAALAEDSASAESGSQAPEAVAREQLFERTLALVSGEARRRGAVAEPWGASASARGGVIVVRL